ncbi:MAG: DUF2181 domain-containing protein [Caldilineaceae bacterium]|nr:DUF2181 domain-containing protein [Caldilineaceae bacterium]HRJ42802.1 DUF2181 domain-containing protein [Caldilineaceae bacterium]
MATRLTASDILQQQLDHLGVARPGDVGWVHGANSRAKLEAALVDPAVHYIEGDISLGGDGQIIMAHPPATSSDLSFTDWLHATIAAGKGAKLDFKSPALVERCLIEAKRHASGRIPLIVNADLLVGPGGNPVSFDPATFLALYKKHLPQAILSPGWKVGDNGTSYSRQQLTEMQELLRAVRSPVTLCFHAWFLFISWPDVKWLLDQTPYTITVWGKVESPELLNWLRKYTNPARCFYDVQDGEGRQVSVFGTATSR